MSASLPICHAILICDAVYIDPLSERASLLGLFDEISSEHFLGRRMAFSVFCQLAGGRGRGTLRLEFSHVHRESLERERIAEAVVEVDYSSAPRSLSANFRFEDLDLHEVGEYGFTLLAGSMVVAERWLRVTD